MANYAEVPFPKQGLNEDAPPGALNSDEAAVLTNVLVHNPGRIERRGPFLLADVDTSITSTMFPLGVCFNGTKAIISYEDTAGSRYNYSTAAAYFNGTSDYQGTAATGQYTGRYWDGATHSAVAVTNYTNDIAGTPDTNTLLPIGRAAYHEGVTYFVSLSTENTYAKKASAPTTVEGTRLVAWSGANYAADSSGTVTVNAGATTLTFSGSKSGLTGTFITIDSDRTTTAPFAYRIISGSGTTWTIEKPYGLGVSGVTNKAGVAFSIRSRDIPIQSPAQAGVVTQHLDRLFIGRCLVRDAVGVLQPQYYPNALKWSQALSPEIWPDENVTLIGAEPNDWITGLASVGRYLIIFKRYSTYVMSGDSEDNFTVRKLIGNIGCLDSRTICEWNDSIVWASYQGVHKINSQLEVENLTERKAGHGISRSYSKVIRRNPTLEASFIGASAAVDDNDYYHFTMCDLNNNATYQADETNGTDPTYRLFPASCHIPTKSWTRLCGTATANTVHKYAASPRFFAQERYDNNPFAIGVMGSMIYLNAVTDPAAFNYLGYWGVDYISNGTSGVSTPFKVDIVWPDIEYVKNSTYQIMQLLIRHLVEYTASSTTAGTTGVIVTGAFDPASTNTTVSAPTSVLGAFVSRITSGAADEGQTTYVAEIRPRSTSEEEALRGQLFRLRMYDTSTAPAEYWNIFKISALIETGRPGRATDPLL